SDAGVDLQGNSQCTVDIAFRPGAVGAASGQAYPFPIPVSGTGVAPQISVSPGSLTFSGSQAVGSSSAAQNITLKNVGAATFNIASISSDKNFKMDASACGSALAPGASCITKISFQPPPTGP